EPPYYSQRVNLLLRDILLLTLRTCTRKSKKADDKLDMIIRYIDAYCTMDIDFRTLSNSMNYSYDYLRHYFKAKKKMSLKQYIITKRIDLAKEQLTTNMPVSKVAAACGFASPSYFSAVFRQFTGMTPSQYQEHRRRFPNENYTILCEPDG
ncbi:MAG TPA: helix-turn-helix transcriptional regulator, partial [Firmicutes bacterium]|nr:helix-turn-helix transcriptional regulator [Bacillota bacterium]